MTPLAINPIELLPTVPRDTPARVSFAWPHPTGPRHLILQFEAAPTGSTIACGVPPDRTPAGRIHPTRIGSLASIPIGM